VHKQMEILKIPCHEISMLCDFNCGLLYVLVFNVEPIQLRLVSIGLLLIKIIHQLLSMNCANLRNSVQHLRDWKGFAYSLYICSQYFPKSMKNSWIRGKLNTLKNLLSLNWFVMQDGCLEKARWARTLPQCWICFQVENLGKNPK
jgi:hypothetical protein